MKSIFAILLFFLLLTNAVNAAPDLSRHNHAEFIALKGAEATNFKLPADVHLIGTTKLKTPGVESKRYQQVVGNAEVLGGQLTVLNNTKGETIAVIGENFPNLMSTNDITINDKSAQAVVAKKMGSTGKWSTKLMINPSDGRYFYIVENQRSDSRWFHWIDASNGSVINAYDGLTTGDGFGVDGNTKTPLDTTKNGAQYQMVSSDGRQKNLRCTK